MLSVSIVLWSIASLFSAFAGQLLERCCSHGCCWALVVATAGPAIASLTGDYFPAQERGKIYAYILGGEIAGTAFGFIISSSVASAISWRAAFILLAIPGFFLARELYRTVPEPLRGGQSHLEPGVEDLVEAAARARAKPPRRMARARRDADQDRGRRSAGRPPARRAGRPGAGAEGGPAHDDACGLGPLRDADPDERDDDHQLVARLLLLRRPADVRAACSSRSTTAPARPRPSWCSRCSWSARWSARCSAAG